jgi:hypothetical protein
MRISCGRFAAILAFLLGGLPLAAQESEKKWVDEAVRTSLVSLHREGQYLDRDDFTGVLLNDSGLAVTPWRKVCVPGTLKGGSYGYAQNLGINVVAVHPTRDLALVQIDLSGGRNYFKGKPAALASGAPGLGDPLYLCRLGGQPGTPVKRASETQPADHPDYFWVEPDPPINSPFGWLLPDDVISNLKGQVVGMGTRAVVNGKLVIRFIPLYDYARDAFVAPSKRKNDPAKAREYWQMSDDARKLQMNGTRYNVNGDPGITDFGVKEFLRLALAEDPDNAETFRRLGMSARFNEINTGSSALLARSLQLDPWSESSRDVYFELGKKFYDTLTQKPDALAVWTEGASKFPTKGSKLWEWLAKGHFETGNFYQAARCAKLAGETGSSTSELHDIHAKAMLRLSEQSQRDLNQFENKVSEEIRKMAEEADKAHRESRDWMTTDGKRIILGQGGAAGGGAGSDKKSPLPDPTKGMSDEQVNAEFVHGRLNIAIEHLKAGRLKVAQGILEDIVTNYPKLAESKAAQRLLDSIKDPK